MPGTNIGDDVVIGANSLVSSEIPSNSLAIGSPAKVVKSNYPTKLNNIEKNTLVDSIIKDFIEYMRHHHFDCKSLKIILLFQTININQNFIFTIKVQILDLCQKTTY